MFYGIKFKMTLYYGLFIMEIVDILCIVSVGYKYFINIFLTLKMLFMTGGITLICQKIKTIILFP